MFLAGIGFVIIGSRLLKGGQSFGTAFIVFGMLDVGFKVQDYINLSGKSKRATYVLLAHINSMTTAYISALAAFIVVNWDKFRSDISGFIVWLLPTVLVVPFIAKWCKQYAVLKSRALTC